MPLRGCNIFKCLCTKQQILNIYERKADRAEKRNGWELKTQIPIIDRTTRQKISENTEKLKNTTKE